MYVYIYIVRDFLFLANKKIYKINVFHPKFNLKIYYIQYRIQLSYDSSIYIRKNTFLFFLEFNNS